MKAGKHVSGILAIAGLTLVSACDNADRLSAPAETPSSSTPSYDVTATTVIGPAPMVNGVSATVCADIRGGTASAPAAGAPLQAWACHGGANQKFTRQLSGAVTAYGGALCLDVYGGQAKDGDPVVAWTCRGSTNQKWTYTSAGQLQTAVNGKCLDLWGAKGENGAKLVVWPCHGGSNQKWTFAAAGGAPVPPPVVLPGTTVAGAAALPRVYLNTAMPAVTGRTISVPAGGDLQAALNAAQPGDQVVLAAGATYTGNFVLPVKAGMTAAQWITVRSGGALPAEGTRVGPGNVAQLAKIVTRNEVAAIATTPGTQGWRLTGLEVSGAPGSTWTYTLVAFGTAGSDQSTAAQIPSRLVLDRSYVHGSATFDVRRCVMLNSAASAVIDSYLADCHSNQSDSQGIMGWNGPGPFKIVNNHIEGGHEVVLFGGSDPTVAGTIASDVEIRKNHIFRPAAWRAVWQEKNLLELKTAQRVLVEGNVFENNWVDAQNGFAFVFNSNNQDGGCTYCVTQDVTVRGNVVRNVAGAFNLADHGTGSGGAINPSQPLKRVTITGNVISGLDGSNGRLFQVNGAIAGLTITQNTGLGVTHNVYFITPDQPLAGFVFRNNVSGGQYTFMGAGCCMGAQTLTRMGIPAASVAGNLTYSGSGPGAVPPGNTYVGAGPEAVGFTNLASGDLTLARTGAYSTSSIDGSTPGADVASVTAATSGVAR